MSILDLIFPKKCLGCQKEGKYFCSNCLSQRAPISQICPVCEKPSPFGQTHPFCLTRYSLDGLTSFLFFGGIIRQAIHKLKYRLVTDLKEEFWQIILSELKRREDLLLLNKFTAQYKPIIIPIPLYWYKYNYRGFNQATLFAQDFANYFHLPLSEEILIRNKGTVSQTKLKIKERKANVQNAFFVKQKLKTLPENILLIDDVWTTGSTLKTAGSLLKRSGVKKIWGLTIAR
ncbi:hypothetical protein COS54_00535 [Candidatus Shapirobacteria bacterium CG03_land_8_20_14_0_80_39_12]|uniref:Double zinc ribbon domain-containing protein n=1 Tax=Candidatus Shapirobacteria bacterium CG03_land_8_20_14_0_80_39_12 TaxID=1974879 RepID=A0A2M7BF50_9BACT|nr:MAG: hypothetical protein COS54_00535 [Candidatus Shapirobacteria bacterium CG03_land_8_20_14_0_80_39_12]